MSNVLGFLVLLVLVAPVLHRLQVNHSRTRTEPGSPPGADAGRDRDLARLRHDLLGTPDPTRSIRIRTGQSRPATSAAARLPAPAAARCVCPCP